MTSKPYKPHFAHEFIRVRQGEAIMKPTSRATALLKMMAGASALALSGAASAQTSSTTPAATPLSQSGAGDTNDLTIGVTARYDSNVARTDDPTLIAQRGVTRDDVRISPNVQLNAARSLGRHLVGIRAYLGYDFYTTNSRLNRERLQIEPYAYVDLPVCDLAVDASVGRRLSELGDILILGANPGDVFDNTETTKRVVGRVICGETYGLRPSFEYERASGDNSLPIRQVSDYRITRYQPGVGYSSPGLGEISVYAVKIDTDLPNQLQPNGQISGFSQRGFGLSYRRAIGSRLNFNGSVSHVEVEPYGAPQTGRSGINGSIALTLLASERLQLTAFANRAFTSSLTSNASYELQEGYGLSANYAASSRLRFRLGGQIAPRQLFYGVTPVGAFIEEQTLTDIFAGATYNLNRRVRFSVDGGYQKRDANLNVFDYDGYYASVGVSVSL